MGKKRKKRVVRHKSKSKHRKTKMPISLRLFVSYLGLLGVFYFLFVIIPTSVIFGNVVGGVWAQILNFIFVGVICALIYGNYHKKKWAWYLGMGWFSFEIVNSVISSLLVAKDNYISSYMTVASVYIVIINVLVIWFIFKKKKYYFRHKFKSGKEDNFFVFSMAVLIISMFLLVSSSATTIYLDTTYLSREIVSQMDNVNFDQALFLCGSKYAQERDVCYIVSAVLFEDATKEICENIEFSFYKATCERAVDS